MKVLALSMLIAATTPAFAQKLAKSLDFKISVKALKELEATGHIEVVSVRAPYKKESERDYKGYLQGVTAADARLQGPGLLGIGLQDNKGFIRGEATVNSDSRLGILEIKPLYPQMSLFTPGGLPIQNFFVNSTKVDEDERYANFSDQRSTMLGYEIGNNAQLSVGRTVTRFNNSNQEGQDFTSEAFVLKMSLRFSPVSNK